MRTLTLRRVVLVTASAGCAPARRLRRPHQRGARLCVNPDHPDDSVCDRVVTARTHQGQRRGVPERDEARHERRSPRARFTESVDVSGQRVPIRGVIDLTGCVPGGPDDDGPDRHGHAVDDARGRPGDVRRGPGLGGEVLQGRPRRPERAAGLARRHLRRPPARRADVAAVAADLREGHRPRHRHRRAGTGSTTTQQCCGPGTIRRLPGLPATARVPKVAIYDVWLDDQGRHGEVPDADGEVGDHDRDLLRLRRRRAPSWLRRRLTCCRCATTGAIS